MMICQPLIDAKLLPNRNHCRRFHSAQGIRTPLRRRGVLRSDHGCPTPRADGCKRCLHLSCGELTIISRTPTRARIDYGRSAANGLGYASFGTRGSQVQILPLRPKTNLSFQIFVGGHRQLCSGCVAVECSLRLLDVLREELTRKLIWLTCARPNERSLAAAVGRRGCKLAYYARHDGVAATLCSGSKVRSCAPTNHLKYLAHRKAS